MTDQKLDDYQRIIALSRYSRWNEEKQRRETWEETVDRALEWLTGHVNTISSTNVSGGLKKELRDAMIRMDVLPSMRLLQYAGPAMDKNVTRMFNCTAMRFDNVRAFDETVFLSMSGCGVGGRITKDNVDKLPVIPDNIVDAPDYNYVVPDSLEGWATAVRLHVASLYKGRIMSFDTSLIRNKGARLVTSGGFAPGPKLLVELLDRITEIFLKAKGRKLWTIEVYKIFTKIAGVVVAGGSRRSALITLFSPNDREMTESKKGDWWNNNPSYAYSNNSASFWGQPDMKTFFEFWRDVYQSGAGEPGFVNGLAAKTQAEKFDRDTVSNQLLLNPCTIGSTPILTNKGYKPIQECVGKNTTVWNGTVWSDVKPFSTGFNNVTTVKLSDGTSLTATRYHEWLININGTEVRVQTKDLSLGDKLSKYNMPVLMDHTEMVTMEHPYSQGFYAGDGNKDNTKSWVYGPKMAVIDRLVGDVKPFSDKYNRSLWVHGVMLPKTFVPSTNIMADKLAWFSGLLDADGTVVSYDHSDSLQITSVDEIFLNNIRLMLTTMGVQGKVSLNRQAGPREIKGVIYQMQATYRLLINCADTQVLIGNGLETSRLVIHTGEVQRDARRFVTITSLEHPQEKVETFCFTDELNHRGTFNGIVTGQCAEIFSFETTFLCNLTGVNIRPEDDLKALKDKVRLASILGYWQATVTDFKYIRKEWRENAEKEMLLGVSLSGICDHPVLNRADAKSAELLQIMRSHSKNTADRWANKLGKKKTVSWTTVKPSGNSAQLSGVSSGIHPAYARHYIRRVQQNSDDPLTKFLIDQGVPHEVSKYAANTMVFAFPRKAPDTARLASEMSAIEQLELWLHYKRNYTTHTVSMTCYVDQHEWMEVGAWVYKHFEELIGVSFLPKNDHTYEQAPYEAIDKAQYDKLCKSMPDLDWEAFVEEHDQTSLTDKAECTGAGCDWNPT